MNTLELNISHYKDGSYMSDNLKKFRNISENLKLVNLTSLDVSEKKLNQSQPLKKNQLPKNLKRRKNIKKKKRKKNQLKKNLTL